MCMFVCCSMLKRVDVVDPGELNAYNYKHLTVFYTGLYRALTFPRRIDETDAQGAYLHNYLHTYCMIYTMLCNVMMN